MHHIDIVVQQSVIVEVKAAVLFTCPYCHRGITAARRVAYPPDAVGVYRPVYKCLCRMIIGELVEAQTERGATSQAAE